MNPKRPGRVGPHRRNRKQKKSPRGDGKAHILLGNILQAGILPSHDQNPAYTPQGQESRSDHLNTERKHFLVYGK